jgi:lysyl-tRNA synthetase class I
MRYKADHFKAMIREVVRDEIREVVAQTIAEVLSERYLRKLVEGNATAQPRGVSDLDIEGDEPEPEDDESPGPLANSILGVGQTHRMFHKDSKKHAVKQHEGRSTGNPDITSLFFEGTRPLKETEEDASEGVPVKEDESSRWGEVLKEAERLSESKKPMRTVDPSMEEARIKRMREELDRKP